jgi:hypothetical protein
MRRVVFFFAIAAALVAAEPKSYYMKLYQPATVAGKNLPAGEYQVEVMDQKAVIRDGKVELAEAPVKVETADTKYRTTSVRLDLAGSSPRVEAIKLGGTRMMIVFTPESSSADRSTNQ